MRSRDAEPHPRLRGLLEVGRVVLGDDGGAGVDVGFDGFAANRLGDRGDTKLAHLGGELRDGGVFLAGEQRVNLAAAGIEADKNESSRSIWAFSIDWMAPTDRRAAGRVDAGDIRDWRSGCPRQR